MCNLEGSVTFLRGSRKYVSRGTLIKTCVYGQPFLNFVFRLCWVPIYFFGNNCTIWIETRYMSIIKFIIKWILIGFPYVAYSYSKVRCCKWQASGDISFSFDARSKMNGSVQQCVKSALHVALK